MGPHPYSLSGPVHYNNWKWNMVENRYLHTTEIKLMRQGMADLMRIIGNKIFKSES